MLKYAPTNNTAPAITAAQAQGKGWEMHDKMFENQKDLNPRCIKITQKPQNEIAERDAKHPGGDESFIYLQHDESVLIVS